MISDDDRRRALRQAEEELNADRLRRQEQAELDLLLAAGYRLGDELREQIGRPPVLGSTLAAALEPTYTDEDFELDWAEMGLDFEADDFDRPAGD